jgi:hypothetical protein
MKPKNSCHNQALVIRKTLTFHYKVKVFTLSIWESESCSIEHLVLVVDSSSLILNLPLPTILLRTDSLKNISFYTTAHSHLVGAICPICT